MSNQIGANLGEHKFMFAIPCYDGKVQAETALSCVVVSGKLSKQGIPHGFNLIRGGALIDAVRNEIVYRFMNETDCDILVCIDSDIEFDWESMERLLVFACHYPIVAGAYPNRTDPPKFIVNALEDEPKYNEHGLVAIKGLGFGFVAIQRKVFEEMAKTTPVYIDQVANRTVHQFFKTGELNEKGEYVGEDVYFFKKAVEAGFTPYLDPGISLKHHGSKVYDYRIMDCIDQLVKGESNGIQEG